MKRNLIIAGAASALVVVLFFFVAIKPIGTKISAAETELQTAQGEESSLRLQIKQLQDAQRNAPAISARLAKFDLLLPRTTDIPTFIRQVQDAADASAIDLSSIAPSAPALIGAGAGVDPALAGKGVYTMSTVLTIKGGFFSLVAFLRRLESLQRVVEITGLSISPGTVDGVTTLQTTLTLQMFVVNPTTSIVPGAAASPSPSATPTGGGGAGGPATPAPSSS